MGLTSDELEEMGNHFSNPDGNVFMITTPSQVDRGALMSRYSRSSKSMRRVFLDEFLNNPDRGQKFYERVLTQYGDDSVAELGLAQIAIEGLSNIAVQTVEDRRIGLSFLEKSSRYVSWSAKRNGRYSYYRGTDIMESRYEKIYQDACDMAFDTYTDSIEPVKRYLTELHTIDEFLFHDSDSVQKPFSKLTAQDNIKAAEKAYQNTLNSQALDLLRGLLPAATLTNLGVAGNGRAFEYMISVLRASALSEERDLGERILSELKTTMGPFTKRAGEEHGRLLEEYLRELKNIPKKYANDIPHAPTHVSRLVYHDPPNHALDMVIAGLLYETGEHTFEQLYHFVSECMPKQKKDDMIRSFAELRKNRRHRPPRAFELVSYTFDMTNNFGMFRDMHRHRILTMQRQHLNTNHGFDIPPELEPAGCAAVFTECMEKSREAYDIMTKTDYNMAQYVVNFAYRYRYMIRLNLRELCHLTELRTLPQGHEDYRSVACSMYEQVCHIHPTLSQIMKFVDTNKYQMGRINSEKRTAVKLLVSDQVMVTPKSKEDAKITTTSESPAAGVVTEQPTKK